ncbi:flagellar basal body M-ring protein FliF [Pokkaliibacter plantistimulans]|uniref:Flagellar M-ring protein n=1 Tax=Proteobacteria bacterium 228 TaxID=2083153 RepID=A0A2S5KUT1_9PROT|nr:flagellar basal-body MS-ring/collar protein FliF [Pokkaliibacter plantistimulans]PPC78412.1 flagellar basal body M-ring protein FliF [Pokkaliibacter plantistimulans]
MAKAGADNLSGGTQQGGLFGSLMLGFGQLSIIRQVGLMVGLAASVAIGFAVVLWSQEPSYRPLLGSLNNLDADQIMQVLQTNQIPYKIDTNSGALLVPSEMVNQARIKLAGDGLIGDKTVGFELLDKEQPLGSSQFMEATRYRRGLEGELARTISSILAVKSARVHLALPKESVFVRDSRKPRASVFVELYAGRTLEKDQVTSILNLVASSVAGLDPKDVTVVDQKGRLLSEEKIDSDAGMAAEQFEYTRKIEQTLARRVGSILEPVVGADRYKAEVSADLDFTAVEQTDEQYNPDLPSLRSEQVLDEEKSASSASGIPGALSNQPPAETSVPEVTNGSTANASSSSSPVTSRKQSTRNYELDRTISYTKHQVGRVRRLSVAVVVDDLVSVDPASGQTKRIPWTENELQRLTVLVRDAVGYSAERGDSVNVVNSPFVQSEDMFTSEDIPFWQTSWFWDLVKQGGAVLFVLILVFGVLRPILRSLSSVGQNQAAASDAELRALEGIDDDLSDEAVTLASVDESLLPGPNESFEKQLNAIRGLIADDPGRVAQVIKSWISDE